jgi:hypothetical protein
VRIGPLLIRWLNSDPITAMWDDLLPVAAGVKRGRGSRVEQAGDAGRAHE